MCRRNSGLEAPGGSGNRLANPREDGHPGGIRNLKTTGSQPERGVSEAAAPHLLAFVRVLTPQLKRNDKFSPRK